MLRPNQTIFFLFFLLLVFSSNSLFGQTMIGGSVNGTLTKAESPYQLSSDLVIESGDSLIIEAGVEIQFSTSSHEINIYGSFMAIGVQGDSIYFSGSSPSESIHGGGIAFYAGSSGSLDYVSLNKLGDQSSSFDASIYIDKAEVSIRNTSIVDNESPYQVRLSTNTVSDEYVSYANNDFSAVYINEGTFTEDLTWSIFDGDYRLIDLGGFGILGLTIPDSVEVVLPPSTRLGLNAATEGLYVYGDITIEGTAQDSIYFFGRNESNGTHGAGIIFYAGSSGSLDYVSLNKLGDQSSSFDASIYIDKAEVSIRNTSIVDNESPYQVRLSTNTVSDEYVSYANNDFSAVYINEGTFTEDLTWSIFDGDYRLIDLGGFGILGLTIPDSVEVVLPPSTRLGLNTAAEGLYVYGDITIEGTAQDSIYLFGRNESNGTHGAGIIFYEGSNGSLDYLSLNKLGDQSSSFGASIYIDKAEVSIRNTTIVDSENPYQVRLSTNTVSDEYVSYANNDFSVVYINEGTFTEDLTWSIFDGDYRLIDLGGFGILGLTIPDSVEVVLPPSTRLGLNTATEGLYVYGDITIEGTAQDSIYLFGRNGSNGTHGGGIAFYAGSSGSLDYVSLNKLGDQSSSFDASIYIDKAEVSIKNTSIIDSESSIQVRLSTNTVSDDYVGYENNDFSVVYINEGTFTEDLTWSIFDGEYRLLDLSGILGLTIPDSVEVVLPPSTRLGLNTAAEGLNVYGDITLEGTEQDSIYLFGRNDSNGTHGAGIIFYEGSSGSLDYVSLNKLGDQSSTFAASIYSDGAFIDLQNSSINDSEGIGIFTNSSLTVLNSSFNNIGSDGIQCLSGDQLVVSNSCFTNIGDLAINNLSTTVVNAQNNYWGNPTGPTHTNNPNGTGEEVSDNVNYDNFLEQCSDDVISSDLSISILSPISTCNASFDKVSVLITNTGAATIDSPFDVSYSTNTGSTETITVTQSLDPAQSIEIDFIEDLDANTTSITAEVSLGADENPTNNIDEIVIEQLTPPVITIEGANTICSSDNTILSVTQNQLYNYSWSTGSTSYFTSFENEMPGEYPVSITVIDNNNPSCFTEETINITVLQSPEQPIIQTPTATLCQGETITLSTPTSINSLLWSNGSGENTIEVSTQGYYTLRTIADNGCLSPIAGIDILEENSPFLLGVDIICEGESISLEVSSGNDFLWSTGASSKAIIVNALTSSTYTVTVTSDVGCLYVLDKEVIVTSEIELFAPQNLLPLNATQNIGASTILNWTGDIDQKIYNIYLWESSTPQPIDPSYISQSINFSLFGLTPDISYNWKVCSYDPCGDSEECSTINTFSTRALPDLTILEGMSLPPLALSGTELSLSWEVINNSDVSTFFNGYSPQWTDAVFLSSDDQFDFFDEYIGEVGNPIALGADQTYEQNITFDIRDGVQGEYHVIVCTDYYNQLSESDNSNNCRVSNDQLNIQLSPYPDLITESNMMTGGSGNTYVPGEDYEIEWMVKNQNNGLNPGKTTAAQWYDGIYISGSPTFSDANSTRLSSIVHAGDLEISEDYLNSTRVILPGTLPDMIYVHVCTDIGNAQYEYIYENNNCSSSGPYSILSLFYPDFEFSNIDIQNRVSPEEQVIVNWEVINQASDFDGEELLGIDFFISNSQNASDIIAQLGSSGFSQPLASQDSQSGSKSLRIPNVSSGKYFLLSEMNSSRSIEELNYANNFAVDSFRVESPDIELQEIIQLSPLSTEASQFVELTYQFINIGLGDIIGHEVTDRIIFKSMSGSSALDFETEVVHSINVESGGNYEKLATILIPSFASGSYEVSIDLNANRSILEDGNFSNNTRIFSQELMVIEPLRPNLRALSIDDLAPLSITDGGMVTFDCSYINDGDVALSAFWSIGVYLSNNQVYDNTAVQIDEVQQSQLLTVSDTKSVNINVNLSPSIPSGDYYIHIVLDNVENIKETSEVDNIVSSPLMAIEKSKIMDLAFGPIITAPSNIVPGNVYSIAYQTVNLGNTITDPAIRSDALYISEDNTFDRDTDLAIHEWSVSQAISPGAFIDHFTSFELPDNFAGEFFLFLVLDSNNDVDEGNFENNNSLLLTSDNGSDIVVTYPPAPDLIADALQLNGELRVGEQFNMTGEIANIGEGEALASDHEYGLLISTDQEPSIDDEIIYVNVLDVDLFTDDIVTVEYDGTLSDIQPGNYFMILVADIGNNLIEEVENNNTQVLPISILPAVPIDLLVNANSISHEPLDTIGTSLSLEWSIYNNSMAVSSRQINTAIYLIDQLPFDRSTAILLETSTHRDNIAPLQSRKVNSTFRLRCIEDGLYNIVIVTDYDDAISELNENNNVTISNRKIQLVIPEIKADSEVVSDILCADDEQYFQFVVDDALANETVKVNIEADTDIITELYVAYDYVPTRSKFDFRSEQPFEPNQEIILSNLQKGDYYILVYTTSLLPCTDYMISITPVPFDLLSITNNQGGNTGRFTGLLTGTRFEDGMAAMLNKGGVPIPALTVDVISSTKAWATFDLGSASEMLYDVIITNPGTSGASATLTDGFEVVTGSIATTSINTSCTFDLDNETIIVDNVGDDIELVESTSDHAPTVRPNQVIPITIRFENKNDIDLPIPKGVFASLNGFPLSIMETEIDTSIQEYQYEVREQDGPENILRPGGVGSFTVYSKATKSEGKLRFRLFRKED